MCIMKAEKRSETAKAKQLRRIGIIPGSIYGDNIDKSILIQFSQAEVKQLLKNKTKGSTVTLSIEGENMPVILKEISYEPLGTKVESLSFQKLVEDKKVVGTARIVLKNREKIPHFIRQFMYDISYSAFPADLVDSVVIDLDGMSAGKSIKAQDLPLAQKPNVELLISPETMVIDIIERGRSKSAATSEATSA